MNVAEHVKAEGALADSSAGVSCPRQAGWPRALRPLRHRDYRMLTLGLTVTLLGNGMWTIALVWQIIRMGLGPEQVAAVETMFGVGLLAGVLPAGVAADRLPKLWVMRSSLVVQALLMFVTAFLALTGLVQVLHLAVVSLLFGIAEGFYIPSYTALLPSLLPTQELLAANGIRGMLRPAVQLVLGPAVSAAIVKAWMPGGVFLAEGVLIVTALCCLALIRHRPGAIAPDRGEKPHPPGVLADLIDGFRYMATTRWFCTVLVFAIGFVFVVVGPIEILVPFVIRDLGGDAGTHATVLAVYGLAGAVASMVVSSLPLARRYLTAMMVLWGLGSVPLVLIGVTGHIWVIVAAMVLVGGSMQAANVIWSTLMQRRVPPDMLGRASSMDFFVSLVGLPASFALVVPVARMIGNPAVFVIAGAAPLVMASTAHMAARLGRDELAHPLA